VAIKKTKTRALILAVTFIAFSLTARSQNNVDADSVYTVVDVQPEFPGGRKALSKYVDGKKNHHYPEEARKNNIEGKVVVEFIIHEDGTPGNFQVVHGIGYGCDEAAVEAFKKMPKWKPALVNGKPVKVRTRMAYMYIL
jgi:periplasmic protein TonB